MTRVNIEKGIVKNFLPLANQHGFTLLNEDYTGANHIVELKYKVSGITYYYAIRFIKPNYLKYDNRVMVCSDKIAELYKMVDPNYKKDHWLVFEFRMNGFLHPKNASGIFTSNVVDAYVDKIPVTKERISILAKELYDVYFLPVINQIIPATNSEEKLDKIINELPDLMDRSKHISILLFSPTLVYQVLNGVLLARLLGRNNYGELVDRYLDYAQKFPPGDIEEIDQMRKAIKVFEQKYE